MTTGDRDPLQDWNPIDGSPTSGDSPNGPADLPSDRSVGAEVAFRAAVARAMSGAAPVEVRERVRAQLALQRADGESGHAPIAVLSRSTGRTAVHARPSAFAVAASLLLVAGAILFGIFGPRIGTQVPRGSATSVAEVAAVVVSEHEQCTLHDSCGLQRAPWRSLDEASRELSRLMRREVRVPNLESAGFSFCCGGQTSIPGAGQQSGHLLYCRLEGESCAWLSVFVAPVETRYLASDALGRTGPLDCGIHYYQFLAPGSGELFYFCDGVVTWFVKPSDPTDFEIVRHFFPESLE